MKMTIYEIKRRLGDSTHYFDRKTMKFFKQTLRDFSVYKITDGKYLISARLHGGGLSRRIYNADANKLESPSDNIN
jgi:hypothetical protein